MTALHSEKDEAPSLTEEEPCSPQEEIWNPLTSKAFISPGYVVKRCRADLYCRQSDAVREFIFASVVDYARKGKRYFASMKTIAGILGLAAITVRKAVGRSGGFIKRERGNGERKRPWTVRGLDLTKAVAIPPVSEGVTGSTTRCDTTAPETILGGTPHKIKGVSGSVLNGTDPDLKVDRARPELQSPVPPPPPAPEVLTGRLLVSEFDSLIRSRWRFAEIFPHRALDYTVAEEMCSRLGIMTLDSFRSAVGEYLDSVIQPSAAFLTVKQCKEFLFATRLGKKPRKPKVPPVEGDDAEGSVSAPYAPQAVPVMPQGSGYPAIAVMNERDVAGRDQIETLRHYGVILTAEYLKAIHPSSDPVTAISATIKGIAGQAGGEALLRDISRATLSYSPGDLEGALLGDWRSRFRGIMPTDGIKPGTGSSPRNTDLMLERLREFAEEGGA